ncbi:MAG: alpha-amylase family glycosyl hydrolase, partial [Proteobacteria bacterium]|nr:alpha-amylase family glycosyl hydrolase [Pseudomonadota bacterium]
MLHSIRSRVFLSLLSALLPGQIFGRTCETEISYQDSNAKQVLITGSFSNWAKDTKSGAIALSKTGKFWTTKLSFPEGKNIYKFFVDGNRWVFDSNSSSSEPDSFGGFNSIYQCGSDTAVSQPLAQCGEPEAFDWRDTVMYFAMVDRFYNSDGKSTPIAGASGAQGENGPSAQYEGGDFNGVSQKMDYLAELGISALWLSAPYHARQLPGQSANPDLDSHQYSGYHGYWPSPDNIDYSDPLSPRPRPQVESRFGTERDLHDLVTAAHSAATADKQGIKVLFDYVMKHVDINSGLYRAHSSWYANQNGRPRLCGPENLWDDPYWGTRCSFASYLPSFDFYQPEVRQWSIHDAVWWAKEFKLDGLRLDAVKHIPVEWITELRSRLTEAFPSPAGDRFYLVGEVFDYMNKDKLKKYIDPEIMLDGQFDFPFKKSACEALFRPDGDIKALGKWMDDNERYYDPGINNRALMVNWIGNHDIPRAIHFASRQIDSCVLGNSIENGWDQAKFQQPEDAAAYERLAVAFALMMTSPGIPLIYYGDEIGLAGGGDPDNRRMMIWDDAKLNPHQLLL